VEATTNAIETTEVRVAVVRVEAVVVVVGSSSLVAAVAAAIHHTEVDARLVVLVVEVADAAVVVAVVAAEAVDVVRKHKTMETYYSDLSMNERIEVDEQLADQPEVLKEVQDDHYCAKCFMIWYNCLCSHDD